LHRIALPVVSEWCQQAEDMSVRVLLPAERWLSRETCPSYVRYS
jgi:hypothetical protein